MDKPAVIPPGYMDQREAAAFTGRHPSSLNRLAREGQIDKKLYHVANRKAAPCFRIADLDALKKNVKPSNPRPEAATSALAPRKAAPMMNMMNELAQALAAALGGRAVAGRQKAREPIDILLRRPTLTLQEAQRVFRLSRAQLLALRATEPAIGFWQGKGSARQPLGHRFYFRRLGLDRYLSGVLGGGA